MVAGADCYVPDTAGCIDHFYPRFRASPLYLRTVLKKIIIKKPKNAFRKTGLLLS
ncbi:MAG: hypothetical protein BROFUL_01851 [Candidatus Brocadia fulgida]|uniref:Uncharacterized protein n=1 Tax=Candidatus Brocadia fulgida TaxID=380242 RepID=A0A0M2UWT8_9BACT|nr:MAG: hypothetical protein BROFUL_01851 [Candidatus Brocadia fulgida]